jgi:hypothetical protein
MSDSDLARRIEEQFRDGCGRPFPLGDVLKLKSLDPQHWDYLHGLLDLYFADVAGYACRARRLERRPREQLLEARSYLMQSFFEKHPSLAVYRNAITLESTPDLFRDLARAETLRQQLLVLIGEILARPAANENE